MMESRELLETVRMFVEHVYAKEGLFGVMNSETKDYIRRLGEIAADYSETKVRILNTRNEMLLKWNANMEVPRQGDRVSLMEGEHIITERHFDPFENVIELTARAADEPPKKQKMVNLQGFISSRSADALARFLSESHGTELRYIWPAEDIRNVDQERLGRMRNFGRASKIEVREFIENLKI